MIPPYLREPLIIGACIGIIIACTLHIHLNPPATATQHQPEPNLIIVTDQPATPIPNTQTVVCSPTGCTL